MNREEFNRCLGAKIRRLREAKGMSQEELAARVGYTSVTRRSIINKIEKGENSIKSTLLKKFADVLGVSVIDLLDAEKENDQQIILPIATTSHNTIPLVGQIACGTPILAEENIEEYLPPLPGVQADLALRCKGDSMVDEGIYNGDIAYIKLQPVVANGTIVAVQIGEEATLKRFEFDGAKMVLQPCNKKYKPLIYQGAQLADVKILGRLVGVVRCFA